MSHSIKAVKNPPNISDYNGHPVRASGSISFKWMVLDGMTIHDPTEFYVGSRNDADIIFGGQYIDEKELASVNEDKMFPMMPHQAMISPGKSKTNRNGKVI